MSASGAPAHADSGSSSGDDAAGDDGALEVPPTSWPPPVPSSSETESSSTPPGDGQLGRRAVRWAARLSTGIAIGAMAAIVVAAVIPSRWFVEAPNARLDIDQPAPYARVPAAASSVEEIIEFDDLGEEVTRYEDDGDFFYVTVSAPNQTALSYWVSEGDPTVDFITHEDKYGFQTPSQRSVLSRQQMTSSGEKAQFVALRRLGFDVQLETGDVIVESVLCQEPAEEPGECAVWPPSDELIDPGDTLVSAGGEKIANLEDLVEVLGRYAPGDEIEVTVLRDDEEVTGTVELISSPDEPERPLIGFRPFADYRVELPFVLDFDTRNTGGPSAGLAFALALTDELSEGELTGGVEVAVTGTIEIDGSVGPIGGLVQKASAVEQAGVDIFLVPEAQGPDNIAAARDAVDNVAIIPVATYDEALEFLTQLGGDPLPPPPNDETTGNPADNADDDADEADSPQGDDSTGIDGDRDPDGDE